MPKIADWTEDTRRVLHVSLEGHFEPLQGQGNFMIDPRELEVTFERHGKGGDPEKVFKIKVTGPRIDAGKGDHPIGIRVWLAAADDHDPETVPGWVQELIEVFTHYADLDDQLRASMKAVKWLGGFEWPEVPGATS
jgi:hypothetical protein